MRRSSPYRERIGHLWHIATAPPECEHDPQRRHRARLLNSLLVIIFPMALIVLVLQVLLDPNSITDVAHSSAIKAVLMGILIVILIYTINHTKHYRIANYLAIFIGFTAIVVDAIASEPPHLEIAYLIILPLVGILLLSQRETLVVCVLTIFNFLLFALIMGDIPRDIFKDILTFMLISQAFILFVSDQRDRLEQDRQQLAIIQANNDLLNQLITNLAHDFRTPLSVINSNLYLLRHVNDPAKQQERLEQIEQQSQQLHRLIEDILTIARLDQSPNHNLQLISLAPVLEVLRWQSTPKAEMKDIRLRFDLSDTLPSLLGNADTLQQAFAVIVENALNYTESGGQITIRSFTQANNVAVEVIDTGIGIPADDLPAIFDPFYRVDQARSTETGGTGLGLSIARRVVELHGGEIEVESVLTQGSTFRILIPIAPNQIAHKSS